jgi:hypothetical protein
MGKRREKGVCIGTEEEEAMGEVGIEFCFENGRVKAWEFTPAPRSP